VGTRELRGRSHLLKGAHQVTREQPVAERVAERALGNLTRHDSGRAPRFARRQRDEGAEAASHLNDTFLHERPVRVLDGVWIQLQFRRKLARRWQCFAWFQHTDGHPALDFVGDLPVRRSWIFPAKFDEH